MGTSGLPRSLHSPQVAPVAQLTFVHRISSFCHHDGDKFQIGLKTRFDRFCIGNPYYSGNLTKYRCVPKIPSVSSKSDEKIFESEFFEK